VRDDRQGHAVHGAAGRHGEHRALVVLAGDARDVPVHLDHLRGLHAAGDDAVEEELRGFADAEDAHARVHRADLREHEGGPAEVVDDVALAELAHDARRVVWQEAPAHEGLLVLARDDGQRFRGHALLRAVLGDGGPEGGGIQDTLEGHPDCAVLRRVAFEVLEERSDALEVCALVHRARALGHALAGVRALALRSPHRRCGGCACACAWRRAQSFYFLRRRSDSSRDSCQCFYIFCAQGATHRGISWSGKFPLRSS
jgi:hypothetical protein